MAQNKKLLISKLLHESTVVFIKHNRRLAKD
jgi:hypothetical protein